VNVFNQLAENIRLELFNDERLVLIHVWLKIQKITLSMLSAERNKYFTNFKSSEQSKD